MGLAFTTLFHHPVSKSFKVKHAGDAYASLNGYMSLYNE